MPTYTRADLGKVLPAVRCTARTQSGRPCRAMAARGANVCRVHGGAAPQVRQAAQRRLQNAADVLVQRLLGFALDGEAPDAVALAAIRDALDRAGLNPKTAIEIELKPYEQVLAGLTDVAHISASGVASTPRHRRTRTRAACPSPNRQSYPQQTRMQSWTRR